MNSFLLHLVGGFIHCLPSTRCFALKRLLYSLAGVKLGRNVCICSSAKISGIGVLEIGDNTWIGPEVMIVANKRIIIGSNCDIAPRVFIGDGTHEITPDHERIAGVDICRSVTIGNGCWLCAGVYILAGVCIGNKCVVAAGAIVTKSFDDCVMIAGVPAHILKRL